MDSDSDRGDIWKQWLLRGRERGLQGISHDEGLRPIRDKVLDNAGLLPGRTLLDVGAGTGMIAFGALERVEDLKVIFSDISTDCLEHCRSLAEEFGYADRSSFVETPIEDLAAIPDESVDVVTCRSVLIYTNRKQDAFDAIFRVLKPGGSLSMFEPINRVGFDPQPGRLMGFDLPEIADLIERVRAAKVAHEPVEGSPLLDFDERDLPEMAESAGFAAVQLTYEEARGQIRVPHWFDHRYRSQPNPLAISVEEAARRALDDEERERFEERLRRAFAEQTMRFRQAYALVKAHKE